MRSSDWSSDVFSSDLDAGELRPARYLAEPARDSSQGWRFGVGPAVQRAIDRRQCSERRAATRVFRIRLPADLAQRNRERRTESAGADGWTRRAAGGLPAPAHHVPDPDRPAIQPGQQGTQACRVRTDRQAAGDDIREALSSEETGGPGTKRQ